MKKETVKFRVIAAILAVLTFGKLTAGCAKKDNDDIITTSNCVISDAVDGNSHKFILKDNEFELNDEQYEQFASQVSDANVYYGFTVFGEKVILTQEEYNELIEQLVGDNTKTVVLDDTNTETEVLDNNDVTDNQYEPLTTENFENLVSEYANKYSEAYNEIVSTEDIIKFASIANIDLLSEENIELASELFGEQSKEEYLNDAAKLIGATVMYNINEWNTTLSTEKFIKVSDVVYGVQKEQMLRIEEYTDRIAYAVIKNDVDLVNNIVSEFLIDMNSGSLSKLDDGVGFAAQVNIAVIADGIAKDYLNQENFDMFQVLKTSEKYVSNIFTEYSECNNNNIKTLKKKPLY